MENEDQQHFIIAELIDSKQVSKTAHQLRKSPSFEDSMKNSSFCGNDSFKEDTRPKSKSKEHLNEAKMERTYPKCVRIVVSSSKSIESKKNCSFQNISSSNGASEGQCSLDEIDLGAEEPIQEALTVKNIKKSTIMKKENKKIKSYRDVVIGSNENTQKPIKSSKSIKFSSKKDIFTYKCENKKQTLKKKTKSFRRSEHSQNQPQQCCQLI